MILVAGVIILDPEIITIPIIMVIIVSDIAIPIRMIEIAMSSSSIVEMILRYNRVAVYGKTPSQLRAKSEPYVAIIIMADADAVRIAGCYTLARFVGPKDM